MDGPLLAFKFFLFLLPVLWLFQKLEKVSARFPAFERFVRDAPVLAVLRCADEASVEIIATALRAKLGGGALAALGRRPWPFYALDVRVETLGARILVRAVSCRVLRVEGDDPPSLHRAIDEVSQLGNEPSVEEAWLHPSLFVDLVSGRSTDAGWRLCAGTEPEPVEVPPRWLPAAPVPCPE